MSELIDISVIIPVFNAEKSIKNIITDLLAEERVNIEVIVVNDGSTDNTKNIIMQIDDPRLVYLEQENKGVYAARNYALEEHKGDWVIFLDADDQIEDNFLFNRFTLAVQNKVDVVINNASHYNVHSNIKRPVHSRQPYNEIIRGSEWITSCVKNNEWPHYLWLQTINSAYIRKNKLHFQKGKSHKDIIWTMSLAEVDGLFYISEIKDYIYISNPESITHRNDYYNVRVYDYIDVIETLISYAHRNKNKNIKSPLLRHALVESRHFLGLYRRKITNQHEARKSFNERIHFLDLIRGVTNLSDALFFVKLFCKMKL